MNVGIDLGTTNSLISYLTPQGIPALFPDRNNLNLFHTLSTIAIHQNHTLVGQPAEEIGEEFPEIPVARLMKLHVGSEITWTDAHGQIWPMNALFGVILHKLITDAQIFSHEAIESTVITVPAHFGDTQRKAILEAAAISGIDNASLLDEPVAAALFYGVPQGKEQTILVYDLGGGSFNAAILQTSPDGLYVLANSGFPRIGGKFFDQHVRDLIIKQLKVEGVMQNVNEAEHDPLLWKTAEELKIKIGCSPSGRISKTIFIGGLPHEFVLTRRQLDDIIRDDIEKTIQTCRLCLMNASLGWSDIDRILLVGGSSLLPLVQARIREESGKPRDSIQVEQPHLVVAYGAALHAAQMAGEKNSTPRFRQGCASQALGLMVHDNKTGQAKFTPLIHRNAPLPTSVKRTFFTNRPNQTRIVLELAQVDEEDRLPKSLGHFIFDGIKNPHKNYPIEVTLNYNLDGTIVASANDQVTGKTMEHTISNPGQTQQADIWKWRQHISKLMINE